MSTNAMIYAKQNDGSVKGVYLHWDGYPSWAGNTLLNDYTTDEKVQSLVSLGSISSLGSTIEPPEIVKRFGFSASAYPLTGPFHDGIPKEWRELSDAERKQLSEDEYSGEYTIAYARDRNDPLDIEIYPSVGELKHRTAEKEYEYYWDGSTWYVRRNKNFRKLTQDICNKQ